MLYPLVLTGSVADAWEKHKNLGAAFDLWWMNLFPRPSPFTRHGGGYTTLNFIPTLATMILEVYYRHLPIYGKGSVDEDFKE
jgi:hypothetical protein